MNSMNLEILNKEEEEIVEENKVSLKVKINYLKNIAVYK